MAEQWHQIRNDPHDQYTSNGHRERVVDVYFRIDTGPALGTEDMVTVPWVTYSPDSVRALVDDAVARHQAVSAL